MTKTSTEAAPAAIEARDRLIIALDVDSEDRARRMVEELRPFAGAFKVGLQLFTAAGPAFVREQCDAGHRIFLDLKFHDIPNTVAKAGVEAARLGVWMFNIHALGGNEMMRRTVREVGEVCDREAIARPKIIGVTVLTSLRDDALAEIGIERKADKQVLRLAQLSADAGLDGVVASPLDIRGVRNAATKSEFLIVSPGVRPQGASNDDQARVMTPADAIRAGADHLVVGRPITEAGNMSRAAETILAEIGCAT